MNTHKLLVIGSLCVFTLSLFVTSYVIRRIYYAPEAIAKKLVRTISEGDADTGKMICPTYSDGSAISKESYSLFFAQLAGNVDEQFLLNSKNFKKVTTKGLFPKTTFLPRKRYIQLLTGSDLEKVSVVHKKRAVEIKNNKIGPLIPGKYQFEFEVENPSFGLESKEKTITLDQDKEVILTDSKTFLNNQAIQKQLLGVVADFYQSYNDCIQNNFNFDLLTNVEKDVKKELIETVEIIKPIMEMYSQDFQVLIMNNDSLKVTDDLQMIRFDLYIDLSISIRLKDDKVEENVRDGSENATVTLVYDKDKKEWLVAEIDFETYEQDPLNWKNKQQIKLKKKNKAIWNFGQVGTLI